MLGKLIKHELKATSRWFLPLFALVLILTPINRLTIPTMDKLDGILQVIPGFIMFAYVMSLIVMFAATTLLIIYRFYKSMVSGEGYLTHTLPVSVPALIWSKLLIAALWSAASLVVFFLSLFILLFSPGHFQEFMREFNSILPEIRFAIHQIIGEASMVMFTIQIILLIVISFITAPLIYYASIALGQVISKNKVAGSVAGFFIISVAGNIISGILAVPGGYIINKLDFNDFRVFTNAILPVSLVMALLAAAIYYGITYYIFKYKLNLE